MALGGLRRGFHLELGCMGWSELKYTTSRSTPRASSPVTYLHTGHDQDQDHDHDRQGTGQGGARLLVLRALLSFLELRVLERYDILVCGCHRR